MVRVEVNGAKDTGCMLIDSERLRVGLPVLPRLRAVRRLVVEAGGGTTAAGEEHDAVECGTAGTACAPVGVAFGSTDGDER